MVSKFAFKWVNLYTYTAGTVCLSCIIEGDVMYMLGKAVDDAFQGCPGPPVAADFQKSDAFDLAASGSDFGGATAQVVYSVDP
jgi:hypothetical protein